MKTFYLSLILVFGVAVAASAKEKKPPKGKIVIKGCQKKKKPIKFDHPKHVKWAKKNAKNCQTCHHLVEKKAAKKDKCSDCHKVKQGKGKLGTCYDKSPKKNPFHNHCIGCHKKLIKKDKSLKSKLPYKCKQCHGKKK